MSQKETGSVVDPRKATNKSLIEKDVIVAKLGGLKKAKANALKDAQAKKNHVTFERRQKLLNEHAGEVVKLFQAKTAVSAIQKKFNMETKADILYVLVRQGFCPGEKRLAAIIASERQKGLIPAAPKAKR